MQKITITPRISWELQGKIKITTLKSAKMDNYNRKIL